MPPSVSRNAPCPCGSGKRYKDCCGKLAASERSSAITDPANSSLDLVLNRALEAQIARDLRGAETLYREALSLSPKHADALHMLGVVRMERGEHAEAARMILDALDEVDWQDSNMQHNLGLALSRMLVAQPLAMPRRTIAHTTTTGAVPSGSASSVSVVLPVYNHERYVAEAIRSVLGQDSPPMELIVIDDGSTDNSVEVARQALREADIPWRFVARENRGAAATLNEAIMQSRGDFIQPLNSDDLLAANRLSSMTANVADKGIELGFSAVDCIDANGAKLDEFDDARVFEFRCSQANIADRESVGLSFIASNPAVSTGNLFFSRQLFDRLGGFRDLRYHHDWDFVQRALWHIEPAYVQHCLYHYRFHGRNTISENGPARRNEVDAMLGNFLTEALSRQPTHPLAPCVENWGSTIFELVLGNGMARLLPRSTMVGLYQRMASRDPADARLEIVANDG